MKPFLNLEKKFSLSTKFIVLFELLILFSLGTFGWQMINVSKSALRKNINQQFDTQVENLAKETDRYLANLNLQFAYVLTLKNLPSLDKKRAYLTRILENLSDFASLSLIDTKLNKIELQIGDPSFLSPNNRLLREASDLDKVILDELNLENNIPCLDVIYPAGENLVLLTKVKLTGLMAKIGIQPGKTGKVYLITKRNKIFETKKLGNPVAEFPRELNEELEKNSGRFAFYWKNKNWISSFRHTTNLNWTILMIQEEKEAFAAIEKMRLSALLWMFFSIIGAGFSTFYLAKSLSWPITKLSSYAEILGKGDLDTTIDIRTNTYEISVLAKSLTNMAKDLKIAQQSLVEQEKYKQQLEIARSIQNSFLVKTYPPIQGMQMHAFCQSAEEVGGDFYDFFWLNDHRLGIVLGDVSGKGVPASLLMMAIRAVLRSIISPSALAGEILQQANAILYKDIKRGVFISMFLGFIDLANKRLNYASAGHNPSLLIRENKPFWFSKSGLAIGIDSGKIFNQEVQDCFMDLKDHDLFLAYTDGVVEARNELGEDFGEKRLEKIALRYPYNCQSLIVAINEELKRFVKTAKPYDDITMVSFKIEP
ncbi:MAG: SpoIIE family protein phosphatase [Elusimicrobiota bacterium]